MTHLDLRNFPKHVYDERIERLRGLMREHGLDGVVASGSSGLPPGPMWWNLGRSYTRYLSGFEIRNSPSLLNAVVVVPLEGEPALVVPPGVRGSFMVQARATSWIENIISSYDPDAAVQPSTRWGLISDQGEDVAQALRTTGLARARVGLSGTWAGIERTRELMADVEFVPTVATDDGGRPQDILAPLMAGNTPEEVERLVQTHAAADAAVRRYIEVACTGSTYRDALVESQVAGLRAGAHEIVMYGSMSVDPWSFWDLAGADPNERFREGKLYFAESAHGSVDGYTIQTARSFVLGEPTDLQQRIMAAIRNSVEAVYGAIRAGITGEDLYAIGSRPIFDAGFEPWAQLGHNVGVKPWPRASSLLPGSTEPLHEGQAIVVHVGVTDVESGQGAMAGDSVLIERDGCRQLAVDPAPLDGLAPY